MRSAFAELAFFGGFVGRGKLRLDHEKEEERIADACQRLMWLGALRLSTEVVGRYANMFGLSAVVYGWIGRLPAWKIITKCWIAVKRAQNIALMSNRWLRAVVLGGNTHLDIRSACKMFRVVFSCIALVAAIGMSWWVALLESCAIGLCSVGGKRTARGVGSRTMFVFP